MDTTKMENRFGARVFLGASAGCYKGAHVEISAPYHEWVTTAQRQLEANTLMLEALKRAQPVIERYALEGPAGNSVAADIRDQLRAAIEACG